MRDLEVSFDIATNLTTPSGADLRLYATKAWGNARAVVQINHGLAEHAARYGRFAAFLAGHGFHAYAHDHRGHGRTIAPQSPRASFGPEPAAGAVLADVLAVRNHIAEEHPRLPIILFGHSMGSMIALAFLARHPATVHAAALWNMPLATRLEARAARAVLAWERFRLGSDVPSRILPLLTFRAWANRIPNARTPLDWLSRDPQEVAKYAADPLCGWLPAVGMWRTIFDFNVMLTDPHAFAAMRKDLPIQLIGGKADPVTAGGKTVRRLEEHLRRNGFSNLNTRIYPETRHESLNELNRDLIMDEFVHWASGALRHA